MRKFLLSVILVIGVLVGITGCSFSAQSADYSTSSYEEPSIYDIALEYMANKYGEKFEFKSKRGSDYTGTCSFFASCESTGDELISVQVINYRDEDEREFVDNYIAVKYVNEMAAFVQELADYVFGEARISYEPSQRALSNNLSADAAFEDYLNEKSGLLCFRVCVPRRCYTGEDMLNEFAEKAFRELGCTEVSILAAVVFNTQYDEVDMAEIDEKIACGDCVASLHASRSSNGAESIEIEA